MRKYEEPVIEFLGTMSAVTLKSGRACDQDASDWVTKQGAVNEQHDCSGLN